MALTKLDKNLLGFSDNTDFVKLPSGTTAQRPSSAAAGYFRFNTTTSKSEVFDGASWLNVGLQIPVISSLAKSGGGSEFNPDGGETAVLTGTNFPSSGAVIKVGGTSASSITHTSATSLSFTTPAKSSGDYDVVVTTGDGTSSTLTNGISYSGVPAWTTAAGTIGSFLRTTTPSVSVTVAATSDSTVTYAVTSGALPTGFALNASTGVITGTVYNPGSVTTFNFTITATDAESQATARAFNIIMRDAQTVTYTSSTTFVVPAGIVTIAVRLAGGGGGGAGGGSGGGCGYGTGGAGGSGGRTGAGSSYAGGGSGSTGGNYDGGAGTAGGGAVWTSSTNVSVTPGASIAIALGAGGAGGLGGYYRGGVSNGSMGGRAGSAGQDGGQSSFGSTSTSGTNSSHQTSGNAGNGGSAAATPIVNDQPSDWVNYNGQTGGAGAPGQVELTY
jgi:hypothetical protein